MVPSPIAPEGLSLAEALRADKGLSAHQVEKATGVTHKTILKYERQGHPSPQIVKVDALASFYGVRTSVLLADIRKTFRRRVPDAA